MLFGLRPGGRVDVRPRDRVVEHRVPEAVDVACANSTGIAGLMSGEYTWKGRIAGSILRANSSNTRCWYSISVTNRAAWNSRSPFQPCGFDAVGSCQSGSAATPVAEVSLSRTLLM